MRTNITSSAAGVIALLNEPEAEVKVFALTKLNSIVDVFWAEISEALDTIEMLYEDTTFKNRNMAALVASKVYYHLGSFEDSLTFALGADDLFDVNNTSEYVQTTIAKCIDHYIKLRVMKLENENANGDNQVEIDPRLEAVVNRMFQRCFDDQQYKQAVGIALETRRIDVFERAINMADSTTNILFYALKVCMSLIQSRQFRNVVLRILVKLYMGLKTPDYVNVCQCLIFLDDPQAVAEILENLLKANTDKSTLMAYQIGFDLYENAMQQFVQRIQAALRATAPIPIINAAAPKAASAQGDSAENGRETAMEVDEASAAPIASTKLEDLSDSDKGLQERVTKLHAILGGDTTIALHLQFLIRTNKADPLILKKTKDVVRNSVCHNATVIANAFMYAGTTSDQFLRDNLEWLSRATNWAKFTATASLGVIHKGHEKEALNLMSTYLPKDTGPGSAYSEGGGLYALGLIHVNHGGDMSEYLLDQLKEASTDVVRHGGCLGLGLAAMGTARQDIYEQLKFNLYQDDAITGEAAGIAMGLVMVGTKSAMAIEDMVAYAQETQHEKILRGLAVGIALTMYSRQEEADSLIDSLTLDKDPILRRSGMYTIAMAYCGTGDNAAIKRLLHVAVSDVDDDVRRAAVTSLGFLLFRTPEQCPSVVSLLSESYNPHVRFGAAMALGTACAGTGLKEALALLEPMMNDPINYVRQGALIASALVLVQHNDVTCSKGSTFRQLYAKVINDKHEDLVAKFGAILAQGIIDAGGRNMTITLQSRTGHTNMSSVVGLLVFCQFWYWFPLTHFLSLAFRPTCIVALNADLRMPKLQLRSNAKPSVYAYPPMLEEKKGKAREKVETAVLSTTSKQQRREADKQRDENMDVDEKDAGQEKDSKEKDNKEKDSKEKDIKETVAVKKDGDAATEDTEVKEEPEPEPTFEILANPARVMSSQLHVISVPDGARYIPMKDVSCGGIIMLRDLKPDDSEDIIESVAAGGPSIEEGDEPEPPEPFQWTDD